MQAKARRVIASKHLTFWTLLLAVLTFNNWFLAFFFNKRLLLGGGAVSELSALSQPHAYLFRVLDVVSGLLFVLAALLIIRHLGYIKTRLQYILVAATALFGLANALDALLPLNCSETINSTCNLTVRLSLTHPYIPDHGYSSALIALSYLLLPAIGLWLAFRYRFWALSAISAMTIIIAVISVLSFLAGFWVTHSWSIRATGLSQELQMIAFGLWFIACYKTFLHSKPESAVETNIT